MENRTSCATTRFPTGQRGACSWKGEVFTMGLSWEVPVKAKTPEDCSASILREGTTIEEALTVKNVAQPATLSDRNDGRHSWLQAHDGCQVSNREGNDIMGVKLSARLRDWNFADTADVTLEAHCNQQYPDDVTTTG